MYSRQVRLKQAKTGDFGPRARANLTPSAVNFLYCADSLYSKEILQVDMHFHLLPETLHLAVNIIDCFLPACVVSLAKLQLVGIRCVFLGSWHHL